MRGRKPARKLISTYAISLYYQTVCYGLFTTTLNKVGELNVGAGLYFIHYNQPKNYKPLTFINSHVLISHG